MPRPSGCGPITMRSELSALALTLAIAASLISPSMGHAQDSGRPIVEIPRATEARLEEAWREMSAALPGSSSETEAWERLRRSAAELGLRQMPVPAYALLLQADSAANEGDLNRARLLLDRASVLGPHIARTHFQDAKLSWREQPWNLAVALNRLWQGWSALSDDHAGAAAAKAYKLKLLLYLWVFLATLLPIALWFGRRQAAAMDLRMIARSWLWPRQSSLLLALLLVTPAMVFWSPVLLLPTAALLFTGQLRLIERVFIAVLLVGLPQMWTLSGEIESSRAATLHSDYVLTRAVLEPCDAACLDRLARVEEEQVERASTWRLVRAWVHYRQGTPEARARASALIDDLEAPPEAAASLATLRGNLAYIGGDMDAATQLYNEALQSVTSDQDRAALHINLFRVAMHRQDRDTATDHANDAQVLSTELTLIHLQESSHTQNRLLAAVAPNIAPLNSPTAAPSHEGGPLKGLNWLMGSLTAKQAVYWQIFGLLALFMGLPLRKRRITAEPCSSCGRPTTKLLSEQAWMARRCLRCFELDNNPTILDPIVRDSLEAAVRRHQSLRPALRLMAAIILPGLPQISVGQFLRGIIPFTLMAAAIVIQAAPPVELALPHLMGTLPHFDGRTLISLTLWLPAVAISAAAVWMEDVDDWMF